MDFLCNHFEEGYATLCGVSSLCVTDSDDVDFDSQMTFLQGICCGIIFSIIYYYVCIHEAQDFTNLVNNVLKSPKMKRASVRIQDLSSKLEALKDREEKKDVGSAFGNQIYSPSKKVKHLDVSLVDMGNHMGKILVWQAFTLMLGFASHTLAYFKDGIWYMNPGQKTMKNPGQFYVNVHVGLGLLIVIFFFIMATLIKLGSYNSNYRRIHGYLGYYVVAPVSFIFLSSAVKTEMQVPGPVQQKISRLALPIFCIFVLYRVVQAASKRQIDAHLHYLVAFWGIVCGAGPFRSIALVIGWWKECENGWIVNPAPGIFFGSLPSTFLPMVFYIYINGTWKFPYAKKALLYASFYQLVAILSIPIVMKKGHTLSNALNPCYPRMDYSISYPEEAWVSHSQKLYEDLRIAGEARNTVEEN